MGLVLKGEELILYNAFIIIFVILLSSCATTELKWDEISSPSTKPSNIYGGYSAGCLDGAVSLNTSSYGYQTMRVSRNRYYGHPRLIHFLEKYAKEVTDAGYGILAIGDLSQARGGPMPRGHSSHQIGLDADIWFKRFSKEEQQLMTKEKAEILSAVSMVNQTAMRIDTNTWHENNARVLEIVANHPEVERVFVNFAIKKTLCKKHKGEAWLKKIRPWWGHVYHYHVRLSCPEGSQTCRLQKSVANNDGCDETLAWWFSDEAHVKPALDIKKRKKEKRD